MARKLRINEIGFYHIVSRGNLKCDIFNASSDYEKFLSLLLKIKKDFSLTIHSFCLMRNHYHILVETSEKNISVAIAYLNLQYAIYFNKKYKRVGHLWQSRFFSSFLYDETHALNVAKYIERNPMEAFIFNSIVLYKYQSFYIWKHRNKHFNIIKNSIIFNMSINDYETFISSKFEDNILREIYLSPILLKENGKTKILYKRLNTFFEEDININRNENILKSHLYGYSRGDISLFLNLSKTTISRIVTNST